MVLTQPVIAELGGRGLIAGVFLATIGAAATLLAVKTGYPPSGVQNRENLEAALKAAAIHVPDFERRWASICSILAVIDQ
ncbi:hypothetical protein [Phyllobacterium endophyticum]|uniref:Uncharacterized protein n=1 Tax=Phyllobacterium endophyticum TaxID=1149773 RepID=A0A2P7AQV4_9HYPH|nr:hypothetical protein [Phyllobacterium endophyticum]MBB3237232.1 hypothetical protein [Phyllobacterium endophyticum]PSH56611.1 hypothetical protein CU100_14650 [Phyllobacterium endophyticum]TYR44395.1 hypothetical protein FY050_04525 [Phyllobacterium endophyticum]